MKTNLPRRRLLKSAGTATAMSMAPSLFGRAALADDEIAVASIHDLSGGLDIYGKAMQDAMVLATEEINANGGLLDRQIKLITYDPQSSMQLYTQFAQQAALKDRVAVVHGGITSASREVIRPVLKRFQTLYFYNTQYEGGVCDRNIFCTGQTPAQNLEKLVPYVMEKWGKKIYIVAADYNYGHITSDWVKKYTTEGGGEVVATDFFPLDVTQFGPAIQKIQAAKPDLVMSALVGGAHISFYRQWAAAGLAGEIPMASSTFTGGNEHIVLDPKESNGIITAFSYFESLDTPANKDFVGRWHARFGEDYPYISELAVATYQGMHLWAKGVEMAGSIERVPVIEALESGISFDGPSGKVTIDPATHHCTLDIHIAEVQDRKNIVLEAYSQQKPVDTAAVCDLEANPDANEQFVIDI